MKNIYLRILDIQPTFPDLVLATITGTVGSTPQKSGSSALFGPAGLVTGTIGGGVLEGKIQQIANEAIVSKVTGHYHFNLDKDISHEEEAICGGSVSVLVDATPGNHHVVFEQVRQSLNNRIPGVLITLVTEFEGGRILVDRYWVTGDGKHTIPPRYFDKIEYDIKNILAKCESGDFRKIEFSAPGENPAILIFLEPVIPPDHLIIAGAGHIGKTLARLGRMLDFEVTVVDDRPEYANPENIPDADHIVVKDIGSAMQELNKTRNSYIVIVTRGHKDDSGALKPCIGSDAAYIGMIGSKTKIARMRTHFIQNGWATRTQWDEIYAPVGLAIESTTVAEIAVSIAAQLILVRNSKKKSHV